MLKRQVWMADDDVFDHVVKNSQRVLRLNDQYKNHPCIEKFTKELSLMFVYQTYVLEGEVDAKCSLGDIWNLFRGDYKADNFCRQMINCMKAWDYLQKTLDLPLNTEIIKQTHKIMKDGEKDILVREYRNSQVFAGYHFFARVGCIERYMEDVIFRFHETKKVDLIMAAEICWEILSTSIHLKMETEEFVT